MHLSFKRGFNEKNVTYTTSGVTIFVFKCHYLWPSNIYLENITNLEILPYLLHFSEVLKRILIIKYFEVNVCNRLLQLNAAIVRRITSCKILARHWASRKIWSTKFPLGGGGGGVNHTQPVAYRFYLSYDKFFEISFLA